LASWTVEYQDHDWIEVETFEPVSPSVVFKFGWEPSTFTCELALGDPKLTREIIGPKRNDVRVWRGNNPIFDGELMEVNLEDDRDTLLCTHSDYKGYLQERIYPFTYPFDYNKYPIKWTNKDIFTIAKRIVERMIEEEPGVFVPPYEVVGSLTGVETNYQIMPAEETSILDHLKNLGDREDGFDLRVNRNGDVIDLRLLHPKADDESIVYTITEDVGQITKFNWTNKGPDQTWFMGLGAGFPNKQNARFHTHLASRQVFRRRERLQDFGNIRNGNHLQQMTNAESIRGLFPQKELELSVMVDVAHLPNFWARSLNRPESLLGRRIWVGPISFEQYWVVDAAFKILDMTVEPDNDGNEFVTFGLEMIDG
jgi:hypothetical protein